MAAGRRAGGDGGVEMLAGPHAVLEALRAGGRSLRRILLARREPGPDLAEILRLAEARRIPVEVRPQQALAQQSRGVRSQGVLAEVTPFRYRAPEAVVAAALGGLEPALLLVLDCVQDPQNLGAILRTAEVSGAHGVCLPKDRAAHVTGAVVRAAAGATEHLAIAQVTNVAAFLSWLTTQGLWVVGADQQGDRVLYDLDLTVPLALVIGGEGRGIRSLVKRRCDLVARIPQRGRVGSLNAAAAAAVCLFEVLRQRLAPAARTQRRDPRDPG
jgi:23S rRNA (guanosine2251-2'-O)-methyltransferase